MPVVKPRRELGRTGFVATSLGIGDVADRGVPLDACVATLRRALDAGLNLVDTAPNYEDGYSEQIVGRALAGRREGVFLIDKIDDLQGAVGPQVVGSLARLGLAQVDLFVFHNCSTVADWERLLAAGGGFDQLGREIASGRARFSGVSSHHPDVLRAAIASGRCDVLMFPIGPYVDRRYETEILPLARERGIGVIVNRPFRQGALIDAVARHPLPAWAADLGCTSWAQVLLKFVVSHPAVTCAIPATTRVAHVRENMGAARGAMPDEAMRRRIVAHVERL